MRIDLAMALALHQQAYPRPRLQDTDFPKPFPRAGGRQCGTVSGDRPPARERHFRAWTRATIERR